MTVRRLLAVGLLLAGGCGRPATDAADDRRPVWLDISPAIGAAGGRFVLYADDLELVLEEP